MCAEASNVLRTVALDFFFNCWYLEIPSDNCIRHVPRCVSYHAQGLQLEMFPNFYAGIVSRTPELFSHERRLEEGLRNLSCKSTAWNFTQSGNMEVLSCCKTSWPITETAGSEAWTVFAYSNTGVVGSNHTRGMDVTLGLFCLCCPVCR
jgi:hypothetical protein